MDSGDLRKKFLSFFQQRQHPVFPSDSLIPGDDPTLLFTSAGMVQFKKYFLGQIANGPKRATSCQKCFRTSDIEYIGKTNRHLTFFEMLGNFSFGDYFKEEAIAWAWEFLTREIGLPEKDLFITIYKEDNEAEKIWKKFVPPKKIYRLGEETNFWTMGPTGPCGPCSEILLDTGPQYAGNKPDCQPGCDCDRYLEIWNLVFTQYNRQSDGQLTDLPQKNIDTGMGLERLLAGSAKNKNLFATDLFQPLIKQIAHFLSLPVDDPNLQVKLKIIADHSRAAVMLIADGVLPSNEGRGYALRRIMRRAQRQINLLSGLSQPLIYRLVKTVTDTSLGQTYPEIVNRSENICAIIKMEEEKFLETLNSGTKILEELIARQSAKKILSGKEVFYLYDTFGFPPELTQEIAAEKNLQIDWEEFRQIRQQTQELSRHSWLGSGQKNKDWYNRLVSHLSPTEFVGYTEEETVTTVSELISNDRIVDTASRGQEIEIILPRTPFYPESGGQIGDTGTIQNNNLLIEIVNTFRPVAGLIIHQGKIKNGKVSRGDKVTASIDHQRRQQIRQHHTATHLLHQALRQTLGTQVTQAGSLVTNNYFRFDFTHNRPLSVEERKLIEKLVNEAIQKNYPVETFITDLPTARQMGAMALFGEKYGKEVRAVGIGKQNHKKYFSLELCGGTHVAATGEIGLFKIVSESSVAAGVRRIEAVCGLAALEYFHRIEADILTVAEELKSSPAEISEKIQKIIQRQKQLEKEIENLQNQLLSAKSTTALAVNEINGIKIIANSYSSTNPKILRNLADEFMDKLGHPAIIALFSADNEKISFVVKSSPGITPNARELAEKIAQKISGSAGGRPDFAQGGGKKVASLKEILQEIREGKLL